MLPDMGGHFFATHHWHLVHCAYYWKKMFLASKTGTVIEHRYNNLAHINHCEMMFLKRDPLDKIVTEAGVSLIQIGLLSRKATRMVVTMKEITHIEILMMLARHEALICI
jgi:hypothetical protein